jgi:hypothetical protein
MEKVEEYWGGFLIVHGPMNGAYRAVAYPQNRATVSGLHKIHYVSHTCQTTLEQIYEKIVAVWWPILEQDFDILRRVSDSPPRVHTNHCHQCKHGLSSRYMPVCKSCERSICFNCRNCMCGYSGPRKIN